VLAGAQWRGGGRRYGDALDGIKEFSAAGSPAEDPAGTKRLSLIYYLSQNRSFIIKWNGSNFTIASGTPGTLLSISLFSLGCNRLINGFGLSTGFQTRG
jgi:hypothetical protein